MYRKWPFALIILTFCAAVLWLRYHEPQNSGPQPIDPDRPTNLWTPKILSEGQPYLPDFSFAGFQWGEKSPPDPDVVIHVTDYGAIPNDNLSDAKPLLDAIAAAPQEPCVIQLPPGQINIDQIILIERGNLIIRGSTQPKSPTIISISKPLSQVSTPDSWRKEITNYYKSSKKNIDQAFSLHAHSSGYFWTQKPESDSNKNTDSPPVAISGGKQGGFTFNHDPSDKLEANTTYNICWYNKGGKNGTLLKHIFGDSISDFGSRLYENPEQALVTQPVTVLATHDGRCVIKEPLLHDLNREWEPTLTPRNYLEHVGFESLQILFPITEYAGHNKEDGYNAFYLTDLCHSWVKNVTVTHSDSGILTDHCKNMTFESIEINGRKGHYSIHFSRSWGLLARDFKLLSPAIHNPSFNTGSASCVFTSGEINHARLDQHRGVNQQNLFDNLTIVSTDKLFKHGGAQYWRPTAGRFNTFWNICVLEPGQKKIVGKCLDAPDARIIGLIGAQHNLKIVYGPKPYIEGLNTPGIMVKSLYQYQLQQRKTQ